jgi:putative two-component system response regulator
MATEKLRELAVAAMLHDLGKVHIDLTVVRKPGPLDADERHTMRQHPAAAVGPLLLLDAFPQAHRIAPLHHEQAGEHSYPRSGLDRRTPVEDEGERAVSRRRPVPAWIARAGSILALADRYDALISRRPYKDPWPDDNVRETLRREMPTVAPLLEHLRPPERPPR